MKQVYYVYVYSKGVSVIRYDVDKETAKRYQVSNETVVVGSDMYKPHSRVLTKGDNVLLTEATAKILAKTLIVEKQQKLIRELQALSVDLSKCSQ